MSFRGKGSFDRIFNRIRGLSGYRKIQEDWRLFSTYYLVLPEVGFLVFPLEIQSFKRKSLILARKKWISLANFALDYFELLK